MKANINTTTTATCDNCQYFIQQLSTCNLPTTANYIYNHHMTYQKSHTSKYISIFTMNLTTPYAATHIIRYAFVLYFLYTQTHICYINAQSFLYRSQSRVVKMKQQKQQQQQHIVTFQHITYSPKYKLYNYIAL